MLLFTEEEEEEEEDAPFHLSASSQRVTPVLTVALSTTRSHSLLLPTVCTLQLLLFQTGVRSEIFTNCFYSILSKTFGWFASHCRSNVLKESFYSAMQNVAWFHFLKNGLVGNYELN